MKRFYGSVFGAIVILTVSVNPVVVASQGNTSAQKTVTASAVVVPAQVSELGFLIAGIAEDIPVKEGETVAAGQTLMVLDTPDRQFAVAEAEARLRAAQAQVEIRRNEIIKDYEIDYIKFRVRKFKLNVPHEVIEIADAGVQRAQASVEIAQANLAQGTLLAPYAGTIAAIKVRPGEFVAADQAVVTLATLDTLQIETTDLSELDIANVHIGDAADIFVEPLNKHINGKVIRISPIASTVGGDVVFKVTIAPETQPQGLLWGMSAEVQIKSGE
jgi:RND family efflux transporter MFP subunit